MKTIRVILAGKFAGEAFDAFSATSGSNVYFKSRFCMGGIEQLRQDIEFTTHESMIRTTVRSIHAATLIEANELSSPNCDMVQLMSLMKAGMHPSDF